MSFKKFNKIKIEFNFNVVKQSKIFGFYYPSIILS
jgi:hypothetical protein